MADREEQAAEGAQPAAQAVAAGPGPPLSVPPLVLPSFSQACSLVDTPHSCLEVATHRRHLALSPGFLNKKRSGIQEQLNGELLRYSSSLDGVPVAYDNLKIVGELGDILDDVGFIHLNIQADFVVFRPQRRQTLVGVVNKVAPSHIGCLVHGCFNASIPKPFKMPIEAWQHIGVKIGDHLEFEVSRLDSDAVGVFCIRGFLDRQLEADALEKLNNVAEENDPETSTDNTVKASEDADEAAANETIEIPEDTPKRKAKKRHIQETLPENETEMSESWSATSPSLEEIPKKKLKKLQELNAQPDTAEVDACMDNSFMDNTIMESSSVITDSISKKSRKKKVKDSLPSAETDGNVQTESSLDNESLVPCIKEEPIKSKKKKHKDRHSDAGLDHSLQNGGLEDSVLTENAALDGFGANPEIIQENTLQKHKQHKRRSEATYPHLDSTNREEISISEESPIEAHIIQKGLKKKKHKRQSAALDPLVESSNREEIFISEESPIETPIIQESLKKKKHKRRSEAPDPYLESTYREEISISEESPLETITQESTKKKKHKRQSEALDPSLESLNREELSISEDSPLDTILQESTKKKKHKRRSDIPDSHLESSNREENSISEESPLETILQENPKKEKHKRQSEASDPHPEPTNGESASISEETLLETITQESSKKKRHKRRSDVPDSHLESCIREENSITEESPLDTIPQSSKKKKHKRRSEAPDPHPEPTNVESASVSEESPLEATIQETPKQKKPKKQRHVELPESDSGAAQTEDLPAGQDFMQPKAKKKRKE